ncbi:MAG TPA: VOC family protein [Nitrosospira sp.]|nr:VOC family protein [Nitrosospira sp.]
MTVKPVPEGYPSITPYLIINGAADAIEFYKRAFSALELFRMDAPGGKIAHAEIQIGDSRIMITDDCGEESPFRNPHSSGGSSVGLHLYVNDVDALFDQATGAGARIIKPLEDQFYGDRSAALQDPYGHIWFIATHKEDLSLDQIRRRAEAKFREARGAT